MKRWLYKSWPKEECEHSRRFFSVVLDLDVWALPLAVTLMHANEHRFHQDWQAITIAIGPARFVYEWRTA